MAQSSLTIAFYSPYLNHHAGGGEKHLLDVAAACAKLGHHVSICIAPELDQASLWTMQQRLQAAFGVDPTLFSWIASPLFSRGFSWRKLQWTAHFDVLYYVTDGSLFFSRARANILHVQVPFAQPVRGPINRLKLRNWHTIQTNSYFTKQVIEQHWPCHVSQVLYPLVDDELFALKGHKERVIISVGRFFRQLHSKRQDILVSAFRRLQEKVPESRGWQLVLIGSVEDEAYFSDVRQLAKGLPVSFVTNASRGDLLHWYRQATLYWHAAGFGQDEVKQPEKVEHFGISTIEAMAGGVVPLAVGKGGQKEILSNRLIDLQWQTIDELVTKTSILLRSPEYLQQFRALVLERAHDFDRTHFEAGVAQLLGARH